MFLLLFVDWYCIFNIELTVSLSSDYKLERLFLKLFIVIMYIFTSDLYTLASFTSKNFIADYHP